jgi:oligoribonuclease NrnB/cAMP/cGMP phosphodiesterase (DHH superfamily)
MRIVTRPDFDGIVCDVLLRNIFDIDITTLWVEPYELKNYSQGIGENDIIANLPFVEGCSLWFDHHLTNKIDIPFKGIFQDAPSAAGIIYTYYRGQFSKNFDELILQTDRIDSGNITINEVLNTENYPYAMVASTISGRNKDDESYWNNLVQLLSSQHIDKVICDNEVDKRCNKIIKQDKRYAVSLKKYTSLVKNTAITDFRKLAVEPKGNRFLIYSLFQDIFVDAKIRYSKDDREKVIISLGQNIFNNGNNVNLGELVSRYGGGGHKGAGSCSFHKNEAEKNIDEILTVLMENN